MTETEQKEAAAGIAIYYGLIGGVLGFVGGLFVGSFFVVGSPGLDACHKRALDNANWAYTTIFNWRDKALRLEGELQAAKALCAKPKQGDG